MLNPKNLFPKKSENTPLRDHCAYHKAFKPVPNGHEREAKKEAKRAAKLSDEGFKGVDTNLFFDLGVLRHGQKAESDLILGKVVVGQILEATA